MLRRRSRKGPTLPSARWPLRWPPTMPWRLPQPRWFFSASIGPFSSLLGEASALAGVAGKGRATPSFGRRSRPGAAPGVALPLPAVINRRPSCRGDDRHRRLSGARCSAASRVPSLRSAASPPLTPPARRVVDAVAMAGSFCAMRPAPRTRGTPDGQAADSAGAVVQKSFWPQDSLRTRRRGPSRAGTSTVAVFHRISVLMSKYPWMSRFRIPTIDDHGTSGSCA
jgi:hypothetical protein